MGWQMQFSARLAAGAGEYVLVEVLLKNGIGECFCAHYLTPGFQ